MVLVCLLTVAFVTSTNAYIAFSLDTADQLTGDFSYNTDGVTDPYPGIELLTTLFPHFSASGTGGSSGSEVFVGMDVNQNLYLHGQAADATAGSDDIDTPNWGHESSPASGFNFPDVYGTFVSPYDASTISYSYTDVTYNSNVFAGNFNYQVVPEPATMALFALGGLVLFVRRKFK